MSDQSTVESWVETAKAEQMGDWVAFIGQVNQEHWVPPVGMLAAEAVPWKVRDIEDTLAEAWLYDLFQVAVVYLLTQDDEEVDGDTVFRVVSDVTPLNVEEVFTIFGYMQGWQQPWKGGDVHFPQEVWNKLVLIGLELFRKLTEYTPWQRFAQAYTDRQGLIWDRPAIVESEYDDNYYDDDEDEDEDED